MSKKIILFLLTAVFSIFVLGISTSPANAANLAVQGYAWSDNIGWIQFDPIYGGVFLDDSNGNLSGYAWSDNIGWVWFDATDGTHPSAKVDSYTSCSGTCTVSGWARAIAADGNGWDGWIKMSDTWTNGSTLDKSVSPYKFNGYAWGSDVVGWISLSGTGYGAIISPPGGNQAPISVATISKDGATYTDSITVNQGVATPIYLSASGSSDPDGWTDATNGVSSGGKCEWNSDLNQGPPTFDTTINNPASPSSCNIDLGNLTFNDSPGTYTYQVLRITDKPGAVSNTDTVSVTVVSGATPPNPPTDLSATAGTGVDCEKINLSWTDNSGNETKFEILRTGGGPNVTYEVGANVTTYQDSNVTVGTTYTYKVRACNAAGCSNYTSEASAVPVTCGVPANFSLSNSNAIHATLIGGASAVSNKTTISVVDLEGGFSADVALHVSSVKKGGVDVPLSTFSNYNFSDSTLSHISGEDYQMSQFWVDVPAGTTPGLYTINIEGTGEGLTRPVYPPVNLNIEFVDPGWWQF